MSVGCEAPLYKLPLLLLLIIVKPEACFGSGCLILLIVMQYLVHVVAVHVRL